MWPIRHQHHMAHHLVIHGTGFKWTCVRLPAPVPTSAITYVPTCIIIISHPTCLHTRPMSHQARVRPLHVAVAPGWPPSSGSRGNCGRRPSAKRSLGLVHVAMPTPAPASGPGGHRGGMGLHTVPRLSGTARPCHARVRRPFFAIRVILSVAQHIRTARLSVAQHIRTARLLVAQHIRILNTHRMPLCLLCQEVHTMVSGD